MKNILIVNSHFLPDGEAGQIMRDYYKDSPLSRIVYEADNPAAFWFEDPVDNLQEEVKHLQSQINGLSEIANRVEETLASRIGSVERDVSTLRYTELESVKSDVFALEGKVSTLESSVSNLERGY